MWLWFLFGLSASTLLGSLAYTLFFVPMERSQGIVQKIFYFHVPSAFTMYVFLVIAMTASIAYLINRKRILDHVARASMVTATLFGALVIFSGPIWAKPIWGVYWTWDPRLTTTFVVFVLMVAYHLTRHSLQSSPRLQDKAPIIGAILAILAVLDIPLIHFSVKIWRGLHPSVLKNKDGLAPPFQRAFESMTLSIFLFSALIFISVFYYLKLKSEVSEIEAHYLKRNAS